MFLDKYNAPKCKPSPYWLYQFTILQLVISLEQKRTKLIVKKLLLS